MEVQGISAYRQVHSFLCIVLGALLASAPITARGENQNGHSTRRADFDDFKMDVEVISSSRVLIGYKVAADADPVTQVELWYSRDRGQTWHKAPQVDKLQNPITFDAPGDGLYGFYIALRSARASMPPPKSRDMAHRWVRVDRTVPAVQVLSLSPDDRFDLNREIHIRWVAEDDSFSGRPVSLHYRTGETRSFQPIADSLATDGSYRWTVPEDVSGRVEVKVSATDQAENRGHYVADWLRIEDGKVVHVRGAIVKKTEGGSISQAPFRSAVTTIHSEPDAGRDRVSDRAAIEAKKQYDIGVRHRLRGEYAVAVARYRDALRYDPELVAARNDLAELLLLQNKVEDAEKEFQRILAANPDHRSALKGLAFGQAKRRQYRSAHNTLQKLLSLEPKDAEVWLNFGDVCLFMGDRSLARDAWMKASNLESASAEIKKRARKRLGIYRSNRLAIDSPVEW